jgi:hypothetical protein
MELANMTPEEYEVWSARLSRRLYWLAWAACAAAIVSIFLKAKAACIALFGVAMVLGLLSGSMNPLTFIGWGMAGYTIFFGGSLIVGYIGNALCVIGFAMHESG